MWTILLVEDEVFVRRKLKETMDWNGMGFMVAGEAGNGVEAMEQIRRLRPDVVISDIVMPMMNGVELLKQARQEGFACRFVMLTVMSDFPYVQQALEYGASSYMLKLYMDPASLAETMDKVAKELVQQQRVMTREWDDLYRRIWSELSDHPPAESSPVSSAPLSAIPGANGCKLLVITVLHGSRELPLDEFLTWELVESGHPPMWHTWNDEIISTFFCWLPETERAFLQRKRTVPYGVVYSEWTAREDLKTAWAKTLAKAEALWYRPATGLFPFADINPAKPVLAETWAEEHDILHNLERLRWDAVQGALNHLWSTLEERRVSLHHVSKTANRINRLGARLSMPGAPGPATPRRQP